jgi:hypothetical protein
LCSLGRHYKIERWTIAVTIVLFAKCREVKLININITYDNPLDAGIIYPSHFTLMGSGEVRKHLCHIALYYQYQAP